jgi:hypothetical protein
MESLVQPNCKRSGEEKRAYLGYSIKRDLVNRWGGHCMICGYDYCLRSLCFHHIIESRKDFNISTFIHKELRNKNRFRIETMETLLEEAQKCVLLCQNCHGEHHAGLREVSFLKTILTKEEKDKYIQKYCIVLPRLEDLKNNIGELFAL